MMFDFAKAGPKVYVHPVPGYSDDRSHAPLWRIGGIILALAIVAFAISFLDFSELLASGSGFSKTEPRNPSTQRTSVIQPLPSDPSHGVELTPGLDPTKMATSTGAGQQASEQSQDPGQSVEGGKEQGSESKRTGWLEHRIASGESLSTIFDDLGLGQSLLVRISQKTTKEFSLNMIRPGQTFRVKLDDEGKFEQLIWVKSAIESIVITPDGDNFKFEKQLQELEKRQSQVITEIKNSLYYDGQKAGLSESLIMNLAEIFQWDIDYALGLKEGDHFSLIYETYYFNGKKHKDGEIIAAEFVNQGKRYRAVRYEHSDGRVVYYTPEGKGMRKAFIMTPVDFTRISSKFSSGRLHPVLRKIRAHRGIDYAAPTGTPVKAAGDGKIVFNGWQGGYGRVVIVEHENDYTTVYGHLSEFAKRNSIGAHVSQGQVIGYVGQTGLATGPHLHYEIRIAGQYKDPLKITALPATQAIPKKDVKRFQAKASELFDQLALLRTNGKFAQVQKKESDGLN